MIIELNNKEYKTRPMTRTAYKVYMDAFKQLEKTEELGDAELDIMVDTLVYLCDNKFTAEEVNDNLTFTDIIYYFKAINLEQIVQLTEKLNDIKVFTQGKE